MNSERTLLYTRPAAPELMWVGGSIFSGFLCLLLIKGNINILFAVGLTALLLLTFLWNRSTAILFTFSYLFLLGDMRRMLSAVVGLPSFDFLLLIAPLVVVSLAVPRLLRVELRDTLSKAILALQLVMLLEVFNPAQGGMAVGLSGVFFYIVPVLWFWVGRSIGSAEIIERLVYWVVLPLASAAAILGLAQAFIGFLPYEQAWIDVAVRGYTSLYVGSSVRSFGFSVSAAEYATLLEIATAAVLAASFTKSKRIWIVAFPLLITALVMASGRTTMIKLVATVPMVWIMRSGTRVKLGTIIKMGVFAVVSLTLVSLLALRFAPESGGGAHQSAAQSALAHQFGGLGHPLDDRYSSAGVHTNMVLNALSAGFSHPLGFGLGATTFAAAKFSSSPTPGSSEIDVTDMFTSLGVVGGILYLAIVVLALRASVRYVQKHPRPIALPVLAILFSTLGAWLIGGQYSTCSLAFFLIGALVHGENGLQSRT